MKKKTTTKHQINIKFHFFSCHPGWTGPNCDKCVPLPGCSHHGYCTKPMECLCKYGYDGHFCHNPTCRDGCNKTTGIRKVISISRNGLLKSCARFVIERSEIRKKQHDFKCVHFECRMVLFY